MVERKKFPLFHNLDPRYAIVNPPHRKLIPVCRNILELKLP